MDVTSLLEDALPVVRECLGEPDVEIAERHVRPLSRTDQFSTIGLWRVHGTTTSGRAWSFCVKAVQSVRHVSDFANLPDDIREEIIGTYPWRCDLDAYLTGRPLPDGLRRPRLHRVTDLGDDRVVFWMEDVAVADGEWDLDTFGRAAGLLGALAAMHPMSGPDSSMHGYCALPVRRLFLPIVRNPDVWRHPLVASHADPLLRADLLALAGRIDELLAMADRLPHTMVHGDACPQNLLIPADGSAEFVAIDWSWPTPAVLGFDLGQLLVGRAHSGLVEPEELPAIHETIQTAYAKAAGADPADVVRGYVISFALRSAWYALPFQLLGEEPTPELHELFRKRAGLARFIVDLARGL